jgi:regulatory protein
VPASIITKIERQKRARQRVSLFIDGEFAFGISEETALKFRLVRGMELTPLLREDIQSADAFSAARYTAERFLGHRMRTERELRLKLALKGFSENVVDATVNTFKDLRLLDDLVFAEMFVRDRMLLRPKGRSVLRRELAGKGVAEEIIDSVLARFIDDKIEAEQIHALAEKYLRRNQRLPDEVKRRRLTGFLQRRGYPFSIIAASLKELNTHDRSEE